MQHGQKLNSCSEHVGFGGVNVWCRGAKFWPEYSSDYPLRLIVSEREWRGKLACRALEEKSGGKVFRSGGGGKWTTSLGDNYCWEPYSIVFVWKIKAVLVTQLVHQKKKKKKIPHRSELEQNIRRTSAELRKEKQRMKRALKKALQE